MSDDAILATIDEADLNLIEQLAEQTLDDDARRLLLSLFGKDGERVRRERQSSALYDACMEHYGRCWGCGECGAGQLLLCESLLHLISYTIDSIGSGRMDPMTGERRKEEAADCF